MKLYEFEGKLLYHEAGIPIPKGEVIENLNQISNIDKPVAIKAQTLAGKRGKAGAIKFAATKQEAKKYAEQMLNKVILNETVKKVLIEEKLEIAEEYYLGIIFSQEERSPVFLLSKFGGIDIEDVAQKDIIKHTINMLKGFTEDEAKQMLKKAGIKLPELPAIMTKLYHAFTSNDMKMCEINPLILTKDNKLVAADAVVVLDDSSQFRWKHQFPERVGIGREKTELEKAANAIDKDDYRGVAGKTFIELDGDIGMLSIGGGASMACIDALISYGGKPANFTEFSGNPSAEKVEKLTRVVLAKPHLNGLWIVGVTANFTRIDITFQGIANALKDIKPKFPIVVRRGGPYEKEGFAILRQTAKECNLDLSIYDDTTPMTLSGKIIVDKVNEYKNKIKKLKK
ncbi:succinate--CoA ligase subunit beta [Candidatus Woesearchaeota archaeon]|nr:succinate--CoA ligase subunit beta [Candidatus Woesearchaeota archaeon]